MTDLSYLDRMGEGVGADALRLMARRWVIDDAWSWDHSSDGFTWIGQRLAQRFAVEGAPERPRLVATTTVVEGLADEAAALAALRGFNRMSKGSMWLFDAESGTIDLHCGIELERDHLEARTHDLSTFALLQLFTGEVLAETLAEAALGRAAYRSHPTSGKREEADEILSMVDQALVPIGMGPSQFADPDGMARAAAVFEGTALSLVEGGAPLVVEASGPVGATTVQIRLDPLVGDPDLGSGLLTTVRLDGELSPAPTAAPTAASQVAAPLASPPVAEQWAHRLNLDERRGTFDGPLYGAWEPDGPTGVVHTWFTPNALSTLGRARDTAEISLRRAIWAGSVAR